MTLSLSDLFILASVLQGVFLGLAIRFSPALRSKTNNYLAYFMLLLSGMTLLGWQEWDLFWPDWIWSLMIEFLIPVMLFRYYLGVLNHPDQQAKWIKWLYAPFFFFLIIDLIFDGDFVFDLYLLPVKEENPFYQFYDALLDSLALWWNIALVIWAFIIARVNTSAPREKRQWLMRFSIAMIVVLVVWFLSDYVEARTEMEDPFSAIWIVLSLFCWYMAYAGVYRLRIVDERAEIMALRGEAMTKKVPVIAGTGNDYSPALHRLMDEEFLFRNPDLGRQVVADHLGISEGYLSQIMSTQIGQPFADYVNGYRIEEAKRLLSSADFDRYSLEAIGLEAGFRSRSAFYKGFKEAAGVTPGAYRKQRKTS